MSPTVFRKGKYRFFFFSREEQRKHIHIVSPEGEAKFWLEPIIALANYKGLTEKQLKTLQKIVEENKNDFKKAWNKHING